MRKHIPHIWHFLCGLWHYFCDLFGDWFRGILSGVSLLGALSFFFPLPQPRLRLTVLLAVFVLANFLVYRRLRSKILTLQRLPPEESPVEKSTREYLQGVVSDLNEDQVRFLRALLERAGRASGVELREGEQLGGENLYGIAVSLHKKGLVTIEQMSPEEAGYIAGFQKRQWYQVKPEYRDPLGRILLSER